MNWTVSNLTELSLIAREICRQFPGGAVVGLRGPLGAGKTTFVRAFVESLGYSDRVASPTFVLHQKYRFNDRTIDHFDLYRVEKVTEQDLIEIGYFDALNENRKLNGYCFVEWPERVDAASLLELDVSLELSLLADGTREFRMVLL